MATSLIKRKYIEAITEHICNFEDVLQHNISVILGEPASGKTYQLKEYEKLNSHNSLFIELLDIENEKTITNNINIILLDSIDEALSKNDSDKLLKNKLSRYIKNCKQINSNIKIVITCRYVEWKEIFEEELKSIDKEMQIFYIEKLSKEEVNILLKEKEIVQIEFWKFIEDNYLEELLKNIMMIIHLINNFETYKGKTLKYFEIYHKIIEQHIDVKTDNERNANLETMPLDESIKIASVIATYMTLNRKREVSIEEINVLAHELYRLDEIPITGAKLNIIFDTALFSGTRKNIRFFHKSIQEYLTAYFINIKKLDIDTIKAIFAHKDGFYEEFEEVIIYLTNIEENFFKHFIKLDPIIFRRHPYLSQEEQIKLVTAMLQTLKTDGQKVWSKREYIEDSSLVRLNLKDKLIEIVRENIDTTSVGRELFSYLQSLLDHNYSNELEDIIFEILDNTKNDKKLCLDFMRINHIEKLNYNQRLFDFILAYDLIVKEQDYLYIEIFKVLYMHRYFNDLIVLLENFSDYHDKEQLEKINIDDIVFWLKTIIKNYNKKTKQYNQRQISFLIFLVLKNYRILKEKEIFAVILDFIHTREIYHIDFYISDYEKDKYRFNFQDIKVEFWKFFFSQEERNVYYLLEVFKYCDISQEDIKDISMIYPIENYKDYYICFMQFRDIHIFLMENIEFKTYMEDRWSKQKEQEKKWAQRDKPYLKKRAQEEQTRQLNYQKAIGSLSNSNDAYNIYFIAKHYSDDKTLVKDILMHDLKEKYPTFIELCKKSFEEDSLYSIIQETNKCYYMSEVYDFLFSHLLENEIYELISNDKEYEKLFWHIVSGYNLSKQYFICISKIYTSKLVELSKKLLQTHLFNWNLIYLFKEINIYDTKNLASLIEAIKEIDIKYFLDLNVQKKYLLDILSLDANNYEYLMSLLNLQKSNIACFKFLFQMDINRAMRDYIKIFALNNDINLTFSQVGKLNMLKPNYKYNQFDILNICPHIRKYYKSLLGLLHSLGEDDRDFSSLKNLNDENIRFIVEKYYVLFKEYQHPTGTYTPDIYDNMNEIIGYILKMLGEDTNKILLLETLKNSLHVRGQASIKWQLQNAYNQQLKDRAYSNEYYKNIIDSFETKGIDDRFFDYEKLKNDLIEISLLETENRKDLFCKEEDEINDRFKTDLILKGYKVADQSRGGESQSGKSVGERDLVIRHNQTGIAESVIEAFNLASLNTSVIDEHYTKLIEKYDTNGNEQNFILVYSKTQNFEELWEKYKRYFADFMEESSHKSNLKVGYTEVNSIKIYHLFVNFYSSND